MTKFKTAEEFNALTEEQKMQVAMGIVSEGYRVEASDFVDPGTIQEECIRIEKVAYAIGDFIKANEEQLEEEAGESVHDVLYSFMSEVAGWTNQEYGGGYRDRDDGFWVSSNC